MGEGAFNFQPGESVSELISWRYLSLFRLNAASGASSPVGEWLGTRRLLSESIPRKAKRAVVISRRKTQFSRHARCTRRDRHFVALSISRADRCRFFSPLVSSFFFFFFNKKKTRDTTALVTRFFFLPTLCPIAVSTFVLDDCDRASHPRSLTDRIVART